MRLQPSNCISDDHNADSHCCSLSVVTEDGTPKREIQMWINSCATFLAVMSVMGPSSKAVNSSKNVTVTLRNWEWSNSINVNMVKSHIRYGECV